jgi:hypothetical protein
MVMKKSTNLNECTDYTVWIVISINRFSWSIMMIAKFLGKTFFKAKKSPNMFIKIFMYNEHCAHCTLQKEQCAYCSFSPLPYYGTKYEKDIINISVLISEKDHIFIVLT